MIDRVVEYILQLIILVVSILLMQYLGGTMQESGASTGEIVGAFAGLLLANIITSKNKKD